MEFTQFTVLDEEQNRSVRFEGRLLVAERPVLSVAMQSCGREWHIWITRAGKIVTTQKFLSEFPGQDGLRRVRIFEALEDIPRLEALCRDSTQDEADSAIPDGIRSRAKIALGDDPVIYVD